MDFLLTVGGFDPTGGAGVLRDVRTFERFGFHGTAVITVLTAQNTQGVKAVEPVKGELLLKQLALVLKEHAVKGVKFGVAHPEPSVNEEVARLTAGLKVPVVLDTVLKPTFGRAFVESVKVLEPLLKVALVVTPNWKEFKAVKPLLENFEGFVLVKGIPAGKGVEDRLMRRGKTVLALVHPADGLKVRGTGCALSSALLSLLAKGKDIKEAVAEAVEFIKEYRKSSLKLGSMVQGFPAL